MRSDKVIIGIDEVGRGSWAGPVVAAAVILKNIPLGLADSKKISFKNRIILDQIIRSSAVAIGIGVVSNNFIDQFGLTKAVSKAMHQAVDNLNIVDYDQIIIDGNYNFLSNNNKAETLIRADSIVAEVMAASIVAKVYRDNLMIEFDKIYPGYGFNHNFGYGTKLHTDGINRSGVTRLHRTSFLPIKNYLD